ncbi:MAG: nicotinate (nicotinamide) nucleotide adenylyltransferase [Victivallales bacterium]|nr:nicotinate (nicotinamide) nucleotide adenylyltransferase [Victivallales bacterium]
MRTAVFGGTFDPPHSGHIALARAVINGGYADKILFIPAFRPPHKADKHATPFADRAAMLTLALHDFPAAEISLLEAQHPERLSYTFETMCELTAAHPEQRYRLLIGADSLVQLHRWHRARELAERWPILTYPRPGFPVTLAELAPHWPELLARKLVQSIMELPVSAWSSTAIRTELRQGRCPADALVPGVIKYIQEKRLYR